MLGTTFNNIRQDMRGGVAVVFAIVLPVLLLGVGVAMDYTNAVSQRTKMQNALDSAVIAAIVDASRIDNPKKARGGVNKSVKKVYATQIEIGTVKKAKAGINNGVFQVTANAQHKIPAMMGVLTGKKTMELSVTATANAPIELKSIRLRLTNVEGWWGKTVAFMGVRNGVENEIARIDYNTTGTGNNRQTKISDSNWLEVSDYEDIFVNFTIHDNAFEFEKWCGLRGCPQKHFTTKTAENSDRFFINGRKQPPKTDVSFLKSVDCDRPVKYAWEDGGAMAPDFHFEVDGMCGISAKDDIYLSK